MSRIRAHYLTGLVLAAVSSAQQKDLTSLSLEDFLNVEVTSVDKSPQKLSRTPAAVYVITQEDIRRSGANNLPEVLRLAPGVSVSNISGSAWAVSIRGFGNIYSNKLLVLVDGRTVYSALLSGTLWGEELVMLEDIERIEVIRGPGATMWGANAVSGVINIITKNTKDTHGGLAAVSGGTYHPIKGRIRYGGSMGQTGGWRTWLQYTRQGQAYMPEAGRALEPWPTIRGGARLDRDLGDRDSVVVEGEVEHYSPESPLISPHPQPGQPLVNILKAGTSSGFLMGRWRHVTRRGDESTIQASFDDEAMDVLIFQARVRTLDLDWNRKYGLSRGHTLAFGAGARANVISTSGTPEFRFDPANRTYGILSGFIQDEWQLSPDKLTLTFGAKLERYTLAGAALQPTARLMWTPTPKAGLWASVSRAVRTPAHTDYAARISVSTAGMPFALEISGNEALRPEVLKAFEAGTRFQLGRAWAFDIAAFRHRYTELDAYRVTPPSAADFAAIAMGRFVTLPAIAVNGIDGWNQGVEAEAIFQARRWWQLSGSYSYMHENRSLRPGLSPANSFVLPTYSPGHQGQIRSSWNLGRFWNADTTVYRIGQLTGGALPGYTRLDCRLARRLGESAEFSINGQNLLRPQQREFAGNLMYPAGYVRRSIEAGVRWTF